MCGITGIVRSEGQPSQSLLESMTERLVHRGPDGSGTAIHGPAALGHRRLSIIDVHGGRQPLYNEDESIVLVCNGEIYNHVELRRQLEGHGHRFRTKSDSEVILHAYEEYGDACVDHLDGMFAFALWEIPRRRLLLARDRLGQKPLYYVCDAQGLRFASELKALLVDPALDREIDPKALDQYLAFGYVAAPRTIYRSASKLLPGHRMIYEGGRLRSERYWHPLEVEGEARAASTRSLAEAAEQLEALIANAVRMHMRSDVPVGAFLSGGIDSTGIVSFVAEHSGRSLRTFCVGFEDPEIDELALARATADRIGSEHEEVVLGNADIASVPELVAHFDEPFADSSIVPTNLVTRLASGFVKVCLSGDGGDELFGGYERYRSSLSRSWMDGIPGALRPPLRLLARAYPRSLRGKRRIGNLSESLWQRYAHDLAHFDLRERQRLMRPEWRALCEPDGHLFDERLPGLDAAGDPLRACLLADQLTYLPDDILTKVDRSSMRHSLEVRIPFLDHRIVEFANGLPSRLKVDDIQQKLVLRHALGSRLPPAIRAQPKRGFGLPVNTWLREQLAEWTRDSLLSANAHVASWLEPAEIRRLFDPRRPDRNYLGHRLWALVILEEWCRSADAPVPV